jgi:serine/threonine protein kinase
MKLNKIDKIEIRVFETDEITIMPTKDNKPSGSFGEISLGFIIDGNVPVVVKRYKNWDNSRFFNNDMQRELIIIQFLNQFPETNSVKLYGILYDETKENCYLVLERLNADLKNISIDLSKDTIKNNGRLTALQYKSIFYKLLKSVNAIHSLGFIHNDLKLANIMINDKDIKIIDFGLAKFIGLSPLTSQVNNYSTSKIIRAPDDRISFSTDSYSIGITMIHLCSRSYLSVFNNNYRLINNADNLSISSYLKDDTRFGDLGFDLLLKLTYNDSQKRICVNQALKHPYFQDYIDEPLSNILYGGIIGLDNHSNDYTLEVYKYKTLELCYFEEMFLNYKDIVFPIKNIPSESHKDYYKTINWLLNIFNYNSDEDIILLEGIDTLINVIIRLNNEFITEPSVIIQNDVSNKQIETCINMLLYNSVNSTNHVDIKYILGYKIRNQDLVSYFYKYLQDININMYSVAILITYIYLEIKYNLKDDTFGHSIDFNFFKDICVQVIFCFIHAKSPDIVITIWDIVVFSTIHLLSIILKRPASSLIITPIIPILTIDYSIYNNLFEFYKNEYAQIDFKKLNYLKKYFQNELFSFEHEYL